LNKNIIIETHYQLHPPFAPRHSLSSTSRAEDSSDFENEAGRGKKLNWIKT